MAEFSSQFSIDIDPFVQALETIKDMNEPLRAVRDLLKQFAPAIDASSSSMKQLTAATSQFGVTSRAILDTWNVIELTDQPDDEEPPGDEGPDDRRQYGDPELILL